MSNLIFVAGHNFDRYTDRCDCGKRWLDIHDADETCLQQQGWAHAGHLVMHELTQIRAERARREALYVAAITGRDAFVPVPVPVEPMVEF